MPAKTNALRIEFVGYVEYAKTHFHPEFVIFGHPYLPDGSQVSADTLRSLKIRIPPIDNYFAWRRAQMRKAIELAKATRRKHESFWIKLLCWWQHKPGKYMNRSRIIVTAKKNKPETIIDGEYDVYECARCFEPFTEEKFKVKKGYPDAR